MKALSIYICMHVDLYIYINIIFLEVYLLVITGLHRNAQYIEMVN